MAILEAGFDDAAAILALPGPYGRRLRTSKEMGRPEPIRRSRARQRNGVPSQPLTPRSKTVYQRSHYPADPGRDQQAPATAEQEGPCWRRGPFLHASHVPLACKMVVAQHQ